MADNLQVIYLPTDQLIPYANNARTHSKEQVAQIAASIKAFGFNNPILLDGDNGVIAGHGRLLAAMKLGLEQVPCIELKHLSETEKRAYILADNKIALNSGWDDAFLAVEITELKNEGIDLELTGFSPDELDGLVIGEDEMPDLDSGERKSGYTITCNFNNIEDLEFVQACLDSCKDEAQGKRQGDLLLAFCKKHNGN